MGLWERGWTEWVYQKPILPDELPNPSPAIGPRIPEQSEDKYGVRTWLFAGMASRTNSYADNSHQDVMSRALATSRSLNRSHQPFARRE